MRAYLLPHVPFMLPELGGHQFKEYIEEILDTFKAIRDDLYENPPDAILICSSHYQGSVFEVGMAEEYRGNLANFKKPEVVDVRKGHQDLGRHIQQEAEDIGFLAPNEEEEIASIDYGTIVPLRFIDPEAHIPIIAVSVSLGSKKEHFLWGKKLHDIVERYSDNVVFIASTELTQDFQQDPRAYPSNSQMDVKFSKAVIDGDIDTLESFPDSYFESTEGLLPAFILSGFGMKMHGEISLYTGFVGCGCSFLTYHS